MLRIIFSAVAAGVLLSGCSVATYSHKLEDVQGTERVGVSFDNRNIDYIRVYPNTAACINLDDPHNGYTNNAVGFQTALNNKLEGFPEIPETPPLRREFWVSAQHNIAVRMIAGNGSYSTVTFKPVVGSYYYVTGLFVNPYAPRKLTVYEVYKTEKGYYDKRPVTDLALNNCEDGASRLQQF
ncbi:hypothetical protein ACSHWC_15745 [Pseudomonas fluorescens]